MKYRNKKTGVVLDVNSVMGGDWEPVEKKKDEPETEKKTSKKKASK